MLLACIRTKLRFGSEGRRLEESPRLVPLFTYKISTKIEARTWPVHCLESRNFSLPFKY